MVGALTGAAGVVTHIGSHRGDGFRAALPRIRAAVQAATDLARESLAAEGQRRKPCPRSFWRTAPVRAIPWAVVWRNWRPSSPTLPPSCGLCLDTAHLFAAGYPVHTHAGLKQLVERLRRDGLLERVSLIHLNDSKTPFASGRDQHENPGAGYIGRSGLARVVRHPAFASIPFVLEVPGATGPRTGRRQRGLGQANAGGAGRPTKSGLLATHSVE